MAPKRKRSLTSSSRPEVLTLSSDSSDDSSYSLSASTRTAKTKTRKKRSSSSTTATTAGSSSFSFSSSSKTLSTSQRFANSSSFLAPRSKLFGGSGTGAEALPKLTLGREPSENGVVVLASPPKARRKSSLFTDATLKGMMVMGGSAEEQLERLEYGEGQLLLTTPGRKPGRKKGKGKGKGKKKAGSDDDDEDEDESEEEEDDEKEKHVQLADSELVNFDKIVGPDPDKTVVRAFVSTPRPQLPWLNLRFATTKEPKPRQEPIVPKPKKKKQKKNSDDEEDDKKDKPKRVAVPTRTYAGRIPLFYLHQHSINEGAVKKKSIVTHQPAVDLEGKKWKMGAKFALVTARDEHNRFFLRFALFSADCKPREWTSTENTLFIQDFASLNSPSSTAASNETHTDFSRSFLDFLTSPALSLPAESAVYIDAFKKIGFSSSGNIKLVHSLAGVWDGEEEVQKGGGFDSLARGIDALKPMFEGRGGWKVEYLTPHGTLPAATKFLPRLYAACRGIPPVEYLEQHSSRAISAKSTFESAKFGDGKVVLVYPCDDTIKSAVEGTGESEGRYHVSWEGRWKEAGEGLKGVMRDCVLDSSRVNHSTMILIIHTPSKNDKIEDEDEEGYDEQYEAFLYLGSHTPFPTSWGSFTIPSDASLPPKSTITTHDLGIVYRVASAPSWNVLLKRIKEVMPYERPLKAYHRSDEPAETVERPPPEEGEQGEGEEGKGEREEKGGERRGG